MATRKLSHPLSLDTAYDVVEDYLTWTVHAPSGPDILAAIRYHQRSQISFWDALIIRSGQVCQCAVIWSEDLNPGQVFAGIPVANPFSSSSNEK